LGEGLAQFVLLLLWEVGRDDLEVILLELIDHPVWRGGPAGEREQRRGTWGHFLTHLPDEIIVDPYVGQGAAERTRPCSDRHAQEGHEEDQPEQKAPERAPGGAGASRAVKLPGLGLLVALGLADHGRVFEGDHLTLLQSLQGQEHPVGPVGVVELQYR
jgi:hypothetical protein